MEDILMFKNGIIIMLFIFANAPVFSQDTGQTLSLDKLVEEALVHNPQVQAFRYQTLADSFKISQAGALPDPMISLNLLNLPLDNFVFDQEPMSGKQIAFKQTFPFMGKLGLKEDIARLNTRVSKANYTELKTQLIYNVKQLYFDLYFTDEAIKTTKKNYSLMQEFVSIAEKKYSVGKGLQQDVLKAQVERSKITQQLIELNQKREQLEANLNQLLNRPVNQPLAKTTKPTASVIHPERSVLEKSVQKQRALLNAWRLKTEQRKTQSALAQKSYLPDFSFFIAYTQRDVLQSGMGGVDFLSGGITFSIPLYFWQKQDKQVQEKQIAQKQSISAFQNIRNQVFADLDNVLSALDKNAQLMQLYRSGIIPQASQSLQSAMIGYQTDKVDFLTLINNQKTLFNFELTYTRILSEYMKDLARLEYVTGTQLQ